MGLSEKTESRLKRMPIITTSVFRSKDGKFLVHKTSIVHIKPMAYYKAIVDNTVTVTEESIEDLQDYLDGE